MDGGQSPARGIGNSLVFSYFSFALPNGAAAVDATTIRGPLKPWIDSVTRSGTGEFTVVFKRGFFFPETPEFTYGSSNTTTPANNRMGVTVSWTGSTRTLVINTLDGAFGAANGADAVTRLNVHVDCREQTV